MNTGTEMERATGIRKADGITNFMESLSLEQNTAQDNKPNGLLDLLNQYKTQRHESFVQQAAKEEEERTKLNKPVPLFNLENVSPDILEQKKQLPIYSRKDALIKIIKEHQFVIVTGDTGSGKSTQIPQYLAEAGLHGDGKIGITQPRRVAAKSLATRVAKEWGVELGTTVGYAIRFDRNCGGNTVIKYMTDGMLVRECSAEANLESYSVIIIDEAHERSINTDVCFGLLKRAAKKRPNLKIIISSATLEEAAYSKYFNDAPIFNVSGKGYPVDLIYSPRGEDDYLQVAVNRIMDINANQPSGDILVFLSGQDEIERMWDMIELQPGIFGKDKLLVLPCYGALPFEEQERVFDPTPEKTRKVVLATNIAETSLTIEGIVYVIDCGVFKQNTYNPQSGIYSLVKQQITQFQAIQRSGRAGRTRPGKCYRLYTQSAFAAMEKAVQPEITRCNVQSVVLDLISMGISNPLDFDFMNPPPTNSIMESIEHLQELSALDPSLTLTPLGRRMSEFPLDPPLAKILLESEKLGCSSEVLKIVALLSTQHHNLFSRNKRDRERADAKKAAFDATEDGDMVTLLKVYNAWEVNNYSESWCKLNYIQHRYLEEAEEIRQQLKTILESRGISGSASPPAIGSKLYENIRRAFTAGYFRQVAKKKARGYAYQILGDNSEIFLHPASSLFKTKRPLVIYHEILKTSKPFMRGVIGIEPDWIQEYAPEFAKKFSALVQLASVELEESSGSEDDLDGLLEDFYGSSDGNDAEDFMNRIFNDYNDSDRDYDGMYDDDDCYGGHDYDSFDGDESD